MRRFCRPVADEGTILGVQISHGSSGVITSVRSAARPQALALQHFRESGGLFVSISLESALAARGAPNSGDPWLQRDRQAAAAFCLQIYERWLPGERAY